MNGDVMNGDISTSIRNPKNNTGQNHDRDTIKHTASEENKKHTRDQKILKDH